MSNKIFNKLLKSLNNGILPDELNYKTTNNDQIDLDKVRYNSFYRSDEYFLSKYPKGFETIPGFDKIIEYSKNNAVSPLEEITNLQNININN